MRYSITAPDNATLLAAIGAIRAQQYANGMPTSWELTIADDGLSATLDTTSTVAPTGLPAGAAYAHGPGTGSTSQP